MRVLILFSFATLALCCPREPSIYHSKTEKSPGDNGVQIRINGNPEKYIPGKVYTMYIVATNLFDQNQKFRRFTLNGESLNEPGNFDPQKVGNFQLFRSSLANFNFECINTLSEINDTLKTEVFFMWTAPPPGSGCVSFKAMILKDAYTWFADEGGLQKTICEQTESDTASDPDECCACDEATYSLLFQGIWSNITHPKDFPNLLWLTHFSDLIGATHEKNFSFWGEGQIASEGFRSLAEWGSIRLMETELRAKSKYLRTIIKATGLWYPNVNGNTTAKFKVDRRHHMMSVASMLGPTPDWVVGLNNLNLCLKDCTWKDSLEIDLFPYDAGTDSGISYLSPNAETTPRERIYRITTTYPEDPRAPFYDPSKKEMPPLAKLYLKREKITPRNCDESFLTAQVETSENTEDTTRAECVVSEYTKWSPCSVTCGKGLRMRTREYLLPQKAVMFKCTRQLISKEMCVADVPECPEGQGDKSEELSIEEPLAEDNTGICATTPWSPWTECSSSCGIGFKMRTRHFIEKMGNKKCPHISTIEKEKCMKPACTGSITTEKPDPTCPTTDWSDWSPCSASCGRGVKFRTRLLLVEPFLQQTCSSRVELIQQSHCVDTPDCTFDMQTAKVVCMQESEPGECQGYFNRWYFDSKQLLCLPFIYSGCRGNRNNFLTFGDCMDSCKIVRDVLSGKIPNAPVNTVIRLPVATLPPPVDCMVSPFTPWSPCTTSCGTGITQSSRFIKRQPENGGKACPAKLVRTRKCIGPPCPGEEDENEA